MLNIEQRMLALLQQQLPANTQIVEAVSVTEDTSNLIVLFNNKRYPISMAKLNVSEMFDNRRVSIMAKPGELLNDVIKRLGDEQRLYLIAGVDYDFGTDKVDYAGQRSMMLQLTIDAASAVAYGRINIVLKNPEAFPLYQARQTNKLIKTPLVYEHLSLALASKVFDFGTDPVVGSTVTDAMDKQVISYLKNCGIPLQDDAQAAFKAAEIFSVVHDGISYLVGVKLKAGITYLMRVKGQAEAVTK